MNSPITVQYYDADQSQHCHSHVTTAAMSVSWLYVGGSCHVYINGTLLLFKVCQCDVPKCVVLHAYVHNTWPAQTEYQATYSHRLIVAA